MDQLKDIHVLQPDALCESCSNSKQNQELLFSPAQHTLKNHKLIRVYG